jgi:hypothetical protein
MLLYNRRRDVVLKFKQQKYSNLKGSRNPLKILVGRREEKCSRFVWAVVQVTVLPATQPTQCRKSSKYVQAVMLLTFVRKLLISNVCWGNDNLYSVFQW